MDQFTIAIPDAVLDGLSSRLPAARLPPDAADDWEAGTNPAYLRELIAYWRDRYDWRAHEATLNRFHHFRALIDGTSVHFIYEKGRGPAPLPILLSHGYPDS